MRKWYEVRVAKAAAEGDGDVAEVNILDFIGDWVDGYWGFGVTAKSFVEELSKLSSSVKTIRVRINSPGGDVFSAIAIANALRGERAKGRTVETVVEGLAASAASVVLMAGEPARVADNALVMVHNPWSVAVGEAKDMRKAAETLDAVRDTIVATYGWKSKLSAEEIVALMDAETWMDADEAVANGFADVKTEAGLAVAASFDPRGRAKLHVPEKHQARVEKMFPAPPEKPAAASAEDVIAACTAAALDLVFAESLVREKVTADVLEGRIKTEKDRRAAEKTRGEQVRDLFRGAKLGEVAEEVAATGVSLEAAKPLATKLSAMLDKAEVDAGLSPEGAKPKGKINTKELYAGRARAGSKGKE